MISVIICSIKEELARQVKANIDSTIGVDWEYICIPNVNPSRSLTMVYNEGIARANYPLICFVHEDVEFRTIGWGKIVAGYFSADPQLGMLGLAGSAYKSKTLSGWTSFLPEFDRCHVIQRLDNGRDRPMYFDAGAPAPLKDVVSVDGVFMVIPQKVATAIPFEEQILDGFHFYDVDISVRIAQQYRVAVTFEIDLVHFSTWGDFGDKWVEYALKWHRNQVSLLPTYTSAVKKKSIPCFEHKVTIAWLKRLQKEKISFSNRIKWVAAIGGWKKPLLWPHIGLFFIVKPISKLLRRQ